MRRAAWRLLVCCGVVVSACGSTWAQGIPTGLSPAPDQVPARLLTLSNAPAVTGVVTGTVIAQDTQRPVRMAQVQFQKVAAAQQQNVGGGVSGFGSSTGGTITDMDGTFTANVAPGDYYVTATSPGYIAELTLVQSLTAVGADPAQLQATLPMVHVTADSRSNVIVTIERGGTLGGHVEWEDGSAAAGMTVSAMMAAQRYVVAGQQVLTDDRGNFRLSGLPSGDYLVMATFRPSGQRSGRSQLSAETRVYAPGVFRKSDAKPVSVRAGDERIDVRIVLDLRQLHTVSGTVVSVNPGLTVASGRVTLVDTSDPSLQIAGSIGDHGEFKLPYVPPGTYTMRVSGASTQASGSNGQRGQSALVSFQPFSQSLVVGTDDVSGVAVSLMPAQRMGP